MKKRLSETRASRRVQVDEILPEYDFSRARPNKYAARYAQVSNVVVLEPDVAAVFQSAAEVNDVLRALAGITRKHQPRRTVRSRGV